MLQSRSSDAHYPYLPPWKCSVGQFMYRREFDASRLLRNRLIARHWTLPLFGKVKLSK